MAFELFKTLSGYVEPAIEFLAGEKEYESGDVVGRSGGFLDLVKSGAKAYSAMSQSSEDKEAFQATEYKGPQLKRYSGQAPRGPQLGSAVTPLGLSNPRLQSILKGLADANKTYANPDLNRIAKNVQRNIPQGRRTTSIQTPRLPSAKKLAPATVRKEGIRNG